MRLLILLLLSLISLCSFCQNYGVRVYDSSLVFNGATIAPNGDIMITGEAHGGAVEDAFILHCDPFGTPLVRRDYRMTYNSTWTNDEFTSGGRHLVLKPDSGYFIVGHSDHPLLPQVGHGQVCVIEVDKTLDTLGMYYYGSSTYAVYSEFAFLNAAGDSVWSGGVDGTPSGFVPLFSQGMLFGPAGGYEGIAVAGVRSSAGSVIACVWQNLVDPLVDPALYLFRFDPTDQLIDQRAFITPDNALVSASGAMDFDDNGDIVMGMNFSGSSPMLMKLDINMDTIWCQQVNGPGGHQIRDLKIRDNGKIVVAVSSNTQMVLAQFSSSGQLEWTRQYQLPGTWVTVKDLQLLPDESGYLILAHNLYVPITILTDTAGLTGACDVPPVSLNTSSYQVQYAVGSSYTEDPWSSNYPYVSAFDSIAYPSIPVDCGTFQGVTRARGLIFKDDNGDGLRNPGETVLPYFPVLASPTGAASYSLSSGEYEHIGLQGPVEIALGAYPSWWTLTTDSVSYSMVFTATDTLFENLDFGLQQAMDTSIFVSDLTVGNVPCGSVGLNTATVSALGTNLDSGIVVVHLDSAFANISSLTADSVVGQSIYYTMDSITPFQILAFHHFAEHPSAFSIGMTLVNTIQVYTYDSLGVLTLNNTDSLPYLVTCAYDPNIKLVDPVGEGAMHVVEHDIPALKYTVHYQNTGNDTARTVLIKDQIPAELIRSSFRLIGASHNITDLVISGAGLLEIEFENIMLPDSNANVQASKGWVSFMLDLGTGLSHRDVISNNAGIYFDLNPPITTDDAFVTIRNCGQVSTDTTLYFDQAGGFLGVDITPDYMDYTYQWFYYDSLLVGATFGQINLDLAPFGEYHLQITELTGCEFRTDTFNYMPVGVSGLDVQGSIGAYPNPFDNSTIVDFGGEAFTGKAWLFDTDGAVVREFDIHNRSRLRIHSQGLRSGMYLLRVVDRNGNSRHVRLIIE